MTDQSEKGITTAIDFRKATTKAKWNTREEYGVVETIRDRFDDMKRGRESGCPWASPKQIVRTDSGSSNSSEMGTDWVEHWDRCYKAWNMYHTYTGKPNLKSPVSFAPIEAAIAEFKENDISVTFTAVNDEDKNKAKLMEKVIRSVHRQNDYGPELITTLKEAIITGTSFAHECWLSKQREVEMIMDSKKRAQIIENADKKTLKEVEKKLDEKKPLTEKVMKVDYNDVAYVPVSIYEFYMDPNARCLKGKTHEATDCVWRSLMSLDQFKAEYGGSFDPYMVKGNLDKVVSARMAADSYDESEDSFFETPKDVITDDQVEIIRYYNKQTDKYIVIANDVLVRDGPLPYNHKELPFVMHKWIEFPHLPYGIGLPTVLESLQSEDETLRNMMLEQLHIATRPPMLINKFIYNDIEEGFDYPEAGKKIEVGGEVGGNNIRWFEGPSARMEYPMMRNTIQEDAIKTSGVNPLQYSVPKPNEPVRNNMMAMESTMKSLKKGFKNWTQGYKEGIRQELKIMKQMYTKKRVIQIEGVQLYEEGGELKERKAKGFTSFKVKEKYFDFDEEPLIEIDVDTLVPMSQGLKMQKIEQAMQQIVPLLLNPNAMRTPGVPQMIRYYYETHELPEKLLETLKDESSLEEVRDAEQQENLMKQGLRIPGIPGESDSHLMEHVQEILERKSELDQLEMQARQQEEERMSQPPQLDPYGMPMMPEPVKPNPRVEELRDVIDKLNQHLQTDYQSKGDQAVQSAIAAGSAIQQAQINQLQMGPAMGEPPLGIPPQGPPPEAMTAPAGFQNQTGPVGLDPQMMNG